MADTKEIEGVILTYKFVILKYASIHRDARNSKVALFDGIEEGGIRASSIYSSYNEIDEKDNERAMGGLQDRVSLLKRISSDIHEEVDSHNRMLDHMGMTWILQKEFFQELWTNSKWSLRKNPAEEQADGIIQSRGNLGIDLPPEKVLLFQKSALYKCNMAEKPAVLTRVVDSMTDNLRPTRAEATDVANAVLDGSDAILLGAETLCGLYPIETISTFGRICSEKDKFNPRFYVAAATDNMSLQKAQLLENSLADQ
ncbi:hypothetical protein S83_059726, partial [Arachis hypogaea]